MHMQENRQRVAGRRDDELRPIRISYDRYGYATSSVLLELGNTKVLCSVQLQSSVPPFLKGKKTGWLNAEYAMLPSATATRVPRDSSCKRNGRSVEISRLIGRALRPMINFNLLGEQTIQVDCDVLQADGSTRVVAITGAALAIARAQTVWLEAGMIRTAILQETVAAVSVGISDQRVLLDLDFEEDSNIDADFNIVLTRDGSIIEMQGTAEKKAVSWHLFEQMRTVALAGSQQFFQLFDSAGIPLPVTHDASVKQSVVRADHVTAGHASSASASPLFSMRNRLKQAS